MHWLSKILRIGLYGLHLTKSTDNAMTDTFAVSRAVSRTSGPELARTSDLLNLIPSQGSTALDIGARDGHFSKLLAERFEHVVALDLDKPDIDHPRVESVKGDASQLTFGDNAFDFVLCAGVLEHIPTALLEQVCREIVRVAANTVVIGVPFRQDIRLGRLTCHACGKVSPPWGHVNSFDEDRLKNLFKGLSLVAVSFVGLNNHATNAVSTALMDFAGNPYGPYEQEEPCPWCDSMMVRPTHRTLGQKIATKMAFTLNDLQEAFAKPHANWIHMRFEKT